MNVELVKSYQVLEITGLSKNELQIMRNDGRFAPLPLKCSSKRHYIYRKQEIIDWVTQGCPHRCEWNWNKE